MIPNDCVAVLVPGFRMMIGLVPLVATAPPPSEEEEVFNGVALVLVLEEDPEPEDPPCCAVTTNPKLGKPESPEPGSSVISAVEMPGSVPIN